VVSDKEYKDALLRKYYCPNCGRIECVADPFKGVHCLWCNYAPGKTIDGKIKNNEEDDYTDPRSMGEIRKTIQRPDA